MISDFGLRISDYGQRIVESGSSPGAGLYIHVPFCASVCPYCDFAVTIAGPERRRAYVDGIRREAKTAGWQGPRFDTVYLGGGTPSSLAVDDLGRILEGARRDLPVEPDAEVFCELNPEDVTSGAVAGWRELGVAFASLGVQSFDDEVLRRLGRRHSADDARRAVERLLGAGIATVSIDLIYGVEGQTAAAWRRQLEEAAVLDVGHLSCYQLTFHDGTVFGRRLAAGEMAEAPEPEQAELFELTHAVLAEAGFEGYEASNFARGRDHRSRHNSKYWRHAPYLGIGPSAHSFDGRRRRSWNHRKLRLWQRAVDAGERPLEGSELLTDAELALEAVMLGLRTSDGVDLDELRARWGVDLVASNRCEIERLCASGHLVLDGATLRPTVRGMAVADAIARSLEVGE